MLQTSHSLLRINCRCNPSRPERDRGMEAGPNRNRLHRNPIGVSNAEAIGQRDPAIRRHRSGGTRNGNGIVQTKHRPPINPRVAPSRVLSVRSAGQSLIALPTRST